MTEPTKANRARIARMIAALATGEMDHQEEAAHCSKLYRAIDKVDFSPEEYRTIKTDMIQARDVTGAAARKARYEAESERLRIAIRDARPLPGTHAHELAMSRAGLTR